jgi:virulence factor
MREMSPEAFGWATATQTFGFAGAVHHFLDRVRDRGTPLAAGADAAKTQLLPDRILAAAGLPTEEQPGRVWSSHAKKSRKGGPLLTSSLTTDAFREP